MTRGKSCSLENTSVMKNPIDWSNDAWHREDNAAIRRNGHTDLSVYEIFEITLSILFLGIICLGKVIKIPIAAIKPQNAKT